jgi:hypothetical protein
MSLVKMLANEAMKKNARLIVKRRLVLKKVLSVGQSVRAKRMSQMRKIIPNESSRSVEGRLMRPKTLKRMR